MFIRPTKQDIEKLREIHKEKGFYDFAPVITMTFPLHRQERYQVLAKLPITEKPCGNDEIHYFHNGVLFGKIHFGNNEYKKHYLYSVQVFEQLYIRNGRRYERVSERPLNEYSLLWSSHQPNANNALYKSLMDEVSLCWTDSLERLREEYKNRFIKNHKRKGIGG